MPDQDPTYEAPVVEDVEVTESPSSVAGGIVTPQPPG
jgi:hypothetical protein